jgi:hypothetical protein
MTWLSFSLPKPKWVSGDFIPQKFADALVEENIAGLTESDESDDEFDDVLYSCSLKQFLHGDNTPKFCFEMTWLSFSLPTQTTFSNLIV